VLAFASSPTGLCLYIISVKQKCYFYSKITMLLNAVQYTVETTVITRDVSKTEIRFVFSF